ncbi:MnhB domain-containing protein [Halosegnis marinus]|uniref:MnhB domain-containing protein n=1 Tax=Halosegnis marinus TaxID=3034023 RepID=A0ABD5ZRW0_9EURY|nr:MnhB domain-containing protein [Halosegnis sp. DT85]
MTTERETTVIAKTVTRVVTPFIFVVAIALLFQGHNLPGGGFIAGVLTCTGFALVYVIYGRESLRTLLGAGSEDSGVLSGLTGTYATLFAAGLSVAVLGGLAAMALGYPFLTQAVLYLSDLGPVGALTAEGTGVGTLEVASAFVFDLGVYLVVVGGLLSILSVVGRE